MVGPGADGSAEDREKATTGRIALMRRATGSLKAITRTLSPTTDTAHVSNQWSSVSVVRCAVSASEFL